MMQETEIYDYARQLFDARGTKAIAEAAQKAHAYEEQGDVEMARTWRAIQRALIVAGGPSAS